MHEEKTMSQQAVLQSQPHEFETDNGVVRAARAELADQLSRALADTYVLYLKTQNVHWNVVGPMFYGVHNLTEKQYQDMALAIDDIAERIRAIGFIAPASFSEFEKLATVKEDGRSLKTEEMIDALAEGNALCSRLLRKAVAAAEKADDVKTADLLTERIGKHEENTWMLRAINS